MPGSGDIFTADDRLKSLLNVQVTSADDIHSFLFLSETNHTSDR